MKEHSCNLSAATSNLASDIKRFREVRTKETELINKSDKRSQKKMVDVEDQHIKI